MGGAAKELAPRFSEMNEKEFLDFMELEVKTGRCIEESKTIKSPAGPQEMIKYEYNDGTLVRYKPEGDSYRPGTTYSVEVKKNPDLPDMGPGDIALKVNERGLPVPKGPKDINNPYSDVNDPRHEIYNKAIMDAGHKSIPRT